MMGMFKKVGIAFIICAIYCLPTQGAGSLVGAGALAVADVLAPILLPIAQEFADEAIGKIESVKEILSKEGRCKLLCETLSSKTCSTKKGTSFCKGYCQNMVKVGAGYTLRVRYTDKWSLQKCMVQAQKSGVYEERKDINAKSIAIYGDSDYKSAVNVIGRLQALDEFVYFGGKVPNQVKRTPNQIVDQLRDMLRTSRKNKQRPNEIIASLRDLLDMPKSEDETKALLIRAKADRKRIDDNFQEYIQENFGPQ